MEYEKPTGAAARESDMRKSDLQTAKENLANHTICLCKNGECLLSDKRGISPVMDIIAYGVDLTDYSVADTVVGKATAMLFVKCGIKAVFAKVMSKPAEQVFINHGVAYEYGTLSENIINRSGSDICPMEKAVLATDDVNEAYEILKKKTKK